MVIPTVTEIQSRMLNEVKLKYDIETIKPNSFIYVFLWVISGAMWGCYYFVKSVSKNLFLDTTTDGEVIDRWGKTYDTLRKPGSLAKGNVRVTSSENSINLKKGELLTSSSGSEYAVVKNYNKAVSELGVEVESKEIGKNKNIGKGSQLTFQSSVIGVDSVVTVLDGGVVGGSDKELDDDYRMRILEVLNTIQSGGNKNDYKIWAKEVGSVYKAFVFENYRELGNVGVTFVTDDRNNLIPNESKVAEVRQHIRDNQPVGADVYVYAPDEKSINLSIEIKPNDDNEVKSKVIDNLNEMFRQEAEVAGVVYASKVSEAISRAEGEDSHSVYDSDLSEELGSLVKFKDIQLGKDQIAVLGKITWS